MTAVLSAVVPVFLLILIGYLIRWRKLLNDALWGPAEALVYYILFPALLISTLAKADLTRLEVWPMAGALMSAIGIMAAALFAGYRYLGITGPAFTSLVQGALRQNTYIGLAVAFGVFHDAGLTAAAVAVAAIIPLVNVLSVGVLGHYGAKGQQRLSQTALQMARNPLIIACVVGLGLQLTGIGLPPIIGQTLEILARGALTLGLLAVGAGLQLRKIHHDFGLLALATVLKLVALPAMTALACWAFGVSGIAAFVAIMFNALPTSAASYVLARLLGGDAELMAAIITVQTVVAVVTLPLVLTALTGL